MTMGITSINDKSSKLAHTCAYSEYKWAWSTNI